MAKPSLWEALAGRLERSQHVFLLGIVVAFAVEIVVDWNATFYEINVLRAQLGAKATNYAAVIRLAVEEGVAARDLGKLQSMARRVCGDEEVAFVRISDEHGATLTEAGEALGARYPKQIARDLAAMLADAQGFRARIAASRHRDVFQTITDAEDRLLRRLLGHAMDAPPPRGNAVYLALQDRLYDEATADKEEDRRLVWALGLVERPSISDPKRAEGIVLVALRTTALRRAVYKKLFKGLAITVFFLGVILVQQMSARKAKLTLLSMRDSLAAARAALKAMLPAALPELDGLAGGLAFEQAERLGGTVFDFSTAPGSRYLDVFLALPEGSGVDVAFAAIHLRGEEGRLRRARPAEHPEARFRALFAAYREAPVHRRVDLAVFRVDLDAGLIFGVIAGLAPPSVQDAEGAVIAPVLASLELDAKGLNREEPARIGEPVQRFLLAFPPGATAVLYNDGLAPLGSHPLGAPEVDRRVREGAAREPSVIAEELGALGKKRAGNLVDDLFVLVLRRAAATTRA